jgi:hypothetical protein
MPQMPDRRAHVGLYEYDNGRPCEVGIDLHEPCEVVSFPPEYAIHLAQLLVKHARLAGYAGPFVELPLQAQPHH